MSDDEKRKLTINDPVGVETLGQLHELESRRSQIGSQLLDLEQDRVKLLAAAHRLDEQRNRVYEKLLLDRGITGTEPVEIDAETGKITLLRPAGEPTASPAPAPAQDADPPPKPVEGEQTASA